MTRVKDVVGFLTLGLLLAGGCGTGQSKPDKLSAQLAEKQAEVQRKTMAAQAKAKPSNGAPKKEQAK